ncbi:MULTISPECIES: maleylpyruvate isomerase family mycothiol-dependent enzyme [unclassified Solwaraspora]|uniref:maleylpyruvate isomerase family mycothiol-dependent enzyme n=1 Tax=unclassified Solwaraspora TaxID=2627926 RepID=UPI00259B9771|nr:maleylpyruvate isomerase family mycothiol-dependent enzyme [Solwaraspora sp. WMMA2056]WJK43282.1 maleylpyruvate isomerase family mycothiol-dependent enzyme [Solwaraspora sp. WMMA2056]
MTATNPTSTMLLQTPGECELQPARLLDAVADQRRQLLDDLRGFGSPEWSSPTRCPGWSVHDTVRHMCDVTRAIAADPGDRTLDMTAGFDPRVTPNRWLTASAGEPPAATVDRLAATTDEVLAVARGRLARGERFDVVLPFGPMDWTVLVLHVLWDSWLHERDIFLALGVDRPTKNGATGYATAYGLLIAAAVARQFGDQVSHRLELGGDGGGIFELEARDAVTLTVTSAPAAGPSAAEVTDALAGRGSAAVLDIMPDAPRTALTHLATFFTSPVEQTRV